MGEPSVRKDRLVTEEELPVLQEAQGLRGPVMRPTPLPPASSPSAPPPPGITGPGMRSNWPASALGARPLQRAPARWALGPPSARGRNGLPEGRRACQGPLLMGGRAETCCPGTGCTHGRLSACAGMQGIAEEGAPSLQPLSPPSLPLPGTRARPGWGWQPPARGPEWGELEADGATRNWGPKTKSSPQPAP